MGKRHEALVVVAEIEFRAAWTVEARTGSLRTMVALIVVTTGSYLSLGMRFLEGRRSLSEEVEVEVLIWVELRMLDQELARTARLRLDQHRECHDGTLSEV